MTRTISIDPVTRIEGHARITLTVDDLGKVEDCRFHVTQFRGFEAFCVGRPFEEMPSLTARTCGICPVSHLLAAAKACDELLAVRVPPVGVALRRIINYGQIVQSHALSFFHLSSPDLLLGMDHDPENRHLFGVAADYPEVARDGVALRRYGQQIIERLAGKRIHPAWVVPGGVSRSLQEADRDAILAEWPAMIQAATRNLERMESLIDNFQPEVDAFANFPSLFFGLTTPEGNLEHYDGPLRMVDAHRNIIFDKLPSTSYSEWLSEAVEPDSYLKSPYYTPLGYEGGMYRVGPLARLNLADACGTPLADQALPRFRKLAPAGAVLSSFHFHIARLIEIIHGLERIKQLLEQPDILDPHVRAVAGPNARDGVGISEAPRGTLIHHYRIDDQGRITYVNMVIATGHNNLAMNRGILQAAKAFITGPDIPEGALNRIEAVIRCYDPCLSCSTHAFGQMPLRVEVVDRHGNCLAHRERTP
ncbi:MAG TPA: Ni/Fe hydrogenase subunit alpha [Kiritimatiellia bacterium]|nr:Ni/Fe hydrogenase subunit alpha [Kiritimatiellia bacterium]